MIKKYFLLSILIGLLSACSSTRYYNLENVDTTNLSSLEKIRVQPTAVGKKTELSKLRITSLEETAMTIGAQGGLAWAADQMNSHMNADTKYLDSIFNFNAMVLSHGVMPPVLSRR